MSGLDAVRECLGNAAEENPEFLARAIQALASAEAQYAADMEALKNNNVYEEAAARIRACESLLQVRNHLMREATALRLAKNEVLPLDEVVTNFLSSYQAPSDAVIVSLQKEIFDNDYCTADAKHIVCKALLAVGPCTKDSHKDMIDLCGVETVEKLQAWLAQEKAQAAADALLAVLPEFTKGAPPAGATRARKRLCSGA